MDPVQRLEEVSRTFGPQAAREKLRLLAAVTAADGRGRGRRAAPARRTAAFAATLDFMRACPDDARVLTAVRAAIAGLPATGPVSYPYSYEVVLRLVRLHPDALEIDWEAFEEQGALLDALDLLVTPGEAQGLEDIRITLQDWFRRCRPPATRSDLAFFLSLLDRSGLDVRLQSQLYERCNAPIRYATPHRCAIALPAPRVRFQKAAFDRRLFPIAPLIRRRLPAVRRAGQPLIDVALRALCARSLEIYPLIHANPRDAWLVDGGRGVRIGLIGVPPGFRSPLETLHVFVVFRNEAAIAYGPAGVFLGCCELGVNLFPEFRGGEIRYAYAQIMRVLHHLLGVERFHLTRYAMGEGNDEAIESGAFWFYRRLGFWATNPAVETLARTEEARMAKRPGHRSDRRTLRRLSHTEASFDLSLGRRAPFDFGALGIAQSRFIATAFGGDRAAAEVRCARRIGRLLGLRGSPALRAIAPTLAMIPDLARWPHRDLDALARIVRAKDAPSELRAARLFGRHRRLETALRTLAERSKERARH